MWLIPLYMIEKASAGFTARLKFECQIVTWERQKGILTSYVHAVNHLLETYATEDVITEADGETVRFTQL